MRIWVFVSCCCFLFSYFITCSEEICAIDIASNPRGAFFRFSSALSCRMQHKFETLLQICYWRMPPSHIHTPFLPSERIIPLSLLSRAAVSLENVFVWFSGLLFILITSRASESRRRGAVNYLFPPSFCCCSCLFACFCLLERIISDPVDRAFSNLCLAPLLTQEALRRWCARRFGQMLLKDRPNLISNGSCVNIAVRLKRLRTSVSTSPFQIKLAILQTDELLPPSSELQPFGLKWRKDLGSQGVVTRA